MLKKKLYSIRKKHGGRGASGRVSVRHQGGEHKRFLRAIDWKRNKRDIQAKVESIEYDPNRSASLALLLYVDGERRYIVSPDKLKVGDLVISKDKAAVSLGNAMKLKNIPMGVPIHNLEIVPGKGGQLIRSAGSMALIQSKEGDEVHVKMPSGEIRVFKSDAYATIGQVSNPSLSNKKLKKAGDNIRRGIRPTVRGVAQNPGSHPHGGGEGRKGVGMKSPKTPWGRKAMGKKTRKKVKYSDRIILKRGK
jgi:large subunit ribosomal protein L2